MMNQGAQLGQDVEPGLVWDAPSHAPSVNALAQLGPHSDVPSLRLALHRLCERFGRVQRLDILKAVHADVVQAICFLRMEREEQELQLMKTLGLGRFGGEVVFVLNLDVPVKPNDVGPSSEWDDSNF